MYIVIAHGATKIDTAKKIATPISMPFGLVKFPEDRLLDGEETDFLLCTV